MKTKLLIKDLNGLQTLPSVSYDSKLIAFINHETNGKKYSKKGNLFVIKSNGISLKQITKGNKIYTHDFKIGPFFLGKRYTIIVNYKGIFNYGFYVINPMQGTYKKIKNFIATGVSKDGKYIFTLKRFKKRIFFIYNINVNKCKKYKLKNIKFLNNNFYLAPTSTWPCWDKDNKKIAFCVENLKDKLTYTILLSLKNYKFSKIEIERNGKELYKDIFKPCFSPINNDLIIFAIENYRDITKVDDNTFRIWKLSYNNIWLPITKANFHVFPDGNINNTLYSPNGKKIVYFGCNIKKVKRYLEKNKNKINCYCINSYLNRNISNPMELYLLEPEKKPKKLTNNQIYKRWPIWLNNKEIIMEQGGKLWKIIL